jgi:hypothetical protein
VLTGTYGIHLCLLLTADELEELQKEQRELSSAMFSSNTQSSYQTGVHALILVCMYFGLTPVLPVSDTVLCLFVTFMARSVKYQSIKQYLLGIRAWHLCNGHEFLPWSQRFSVYRTMQGIKRTFGAASTPKQAITISIMIQLFDQLKDPWNDPWECCIWTCMLVAYFGMFRKDNVTCLKSNAFNPNANLCRGDLQFELPGDYQAGTAWIRVRGSKTNQFSMREHFVALMQQPDDHCIRNICPFTWLERMEELIPSSDMWSPLFQLPSGLPLTHSQFVKALKGLCKCAGLNPALFSGHSFRRGSATDSMGLTENMALIQLQGDWMSDAYMRYMEASAEHRVELPSLLADNARALMERHMKDRRERISPTSSPYSPSWGM